jgi:6-phosphogluconolactonase (cycloisomerase 2 family)
MVTKLVGTSRKKDQRYLAVLPDQLQALIQLTVNDKGAADKEIIHLAMHGKVDELFELSHPHFIRIYQDGKLLPAQGPGLEKVFVYMVTAGFHGSKIKFSNLFFFPGKKNQKTPSHYICYFLLAQKVTKKSLVTKKTRL